MPEDNARLLMEIFDLKDKISALNHNDRVKQQKIAGLEDSVRILNAKVQDLSMLYTRK
jgi:cob(I)alamin adenosyltransferase